MKNIALSLMLFALIFTACNTGGGHTKTAKGLEYTLHTKSNGPKAKIGDYLTLNMQYATENDSIIFSSYRNNRPLSFKFQETLFKGALNDGITQMAAGDSATLLVPADSIYGDRLPNFVKKGGKIKYTLTLLKVQSEQEYQAEVEAKKKAQDDADAKLINEYIAKNNLKMETAPSGVRYSITKPGTGAMPEGNNLVVKMKYSLTLLDGKEVESSKGAAVEMPMNRQVKGLRDGIALIKKGGKGKLIVPSTLGYGERQRGSLPANSVLVYDVEIDDIVEGEPVKPASSAPAKLQTTTTPAGNTSTAKLPTTMPAKQTPPAKGGANEGK